VTGARGHRIAVGDLILTRYNDASIPLRNTDDPAAEQSAVRNGQRWLVTRINPDNNRLIARRLDDHTLGAFNNDYVREHITHGYTVTVHSAQGVTADTTHAALSETTTRAMAYVALTRGRDTNTAYLYRRTTEHEYQRESTEQDHVMDRGSGQRGAIAAWDRRQRRTPCDRA
jgi:ATP-dependent exoDNAse (exonuclease V) alpha subunit